jgi:hypothetical protein
MLTRISTTGTGGIPNSVGIKFDLYNNQGEGVDSTGLYTDGAAPTNVGSIDLNGNGGIGDAVVYCEHPGAGRQLGSVNGLHLWYRKCDRDAGHT